jgi:FtsP/CotA-like multicopper oxidase with cupredoxin domain
MRHAPLLIAPLLLAACMHPPMAMDHGVTDGGHNMMHDTEDETFLPAKDMNVGELPEAKPSEVVTIEDGGTIHLNPTIVRKTLNGKAFAMYGYNSQIPGPTLKVKQGSTFTVKVTNGIDLPTSIHWHGIRLDNANDGAVGLTQKEIAPGRTFTYTVTVPDEGIFWYHPHVREDIEQDMGLYGLIHVVANDASAYPPVDREQYVILDDILLEDGMPVPYGTTKANYALMGRFGNTLLVNGNLAPATIDVDTNEVVRYFILNAANTRTFNLNFGDAKAKLVGGDAGRYEQSQELKKNHVISPSERAIVDVLYWDARRANVVLHINPTKIDSPDSVGSHMSMLLGVNVANAADASEAAESFLQAQTHDDVIADIDAFRPYFSKAPDHTLMLDMQMMGGAMMRNHGNMMGETSPDGIEWEDNGMSAMPMANMIQWQLIDQTSGAMNDKLVYNAKAGDKVKIRIVNKKDVPHPMQHPIHFHGQRFLVLSVDGKPNENLVWKDTVLVEKGQTVDILLDATNPGDWMFHCHIAEHLTSGMMGMFSVQ